MDMMKQEFETLAGYEVTFEDYTNIIEPMYMATNLSKQEFVKVIDKKRFALKTKDWYIGRMKRIAKHLKETCEHYTDFEAKEELESLATEYNKRFGTYKGFHLIHTKYTLEYLGECRGCTYPNEIEICTENGHTIEKIKIA